jgi:hypothetical protein
MKRKPSEHFLLGLAHRFAGHPRYKFQDRYLQVEYDKGYDATQTEALEAWEQAGGVWPKHMDFPRSVAQRRAYSDSAMKWLLRYREEFS